MIAESRTIEESEAVEVWQAYEAGYRIFSEDGDRMRLDNMSLDRGCQPYKRNRKGIVPMVEMYSQAPSINH